MVNAKRINAEIQKLRSGVDFSGIVLERIIDWTPTESDTSWRPFQRPKLLRLVSKFVTVNGLWLEFGVAAGFSIKTIAQCCDHAYGFDTFTGLPEEWKKGEATLPVGQFSQNGQLPAVPSNVTLIKGLFEQTLPPFLKAHSEPIAFVHIDSDIYSSCKCILQALKDRFVPGTIICFDEFTGYQNFAEHEIRAWIETMDDSEYQWVGYLGQTAIVSIGDSELVTAMMSRCLVP